MTHHDEYALPPLHPDTVSVHGGREVDPATGAVTPPIHVSTTFERDVDGSYPRGHMYARYSNPNRSQLEGCLARLEAGEGALAFASGSAATMSVLQLLGPGAHVVMSEDCYYGTRRLAGTLFSRWGLECTLVDTSDTDAVAAAIRPETRLLWVESPTNPLMRIADLDALARLAREHNVVSVCDNTIATPIFQNPIRHGFDLVVHSTTKFIGGHSDLLGGAVVYREGFHMADTLRDIQAMGGAVPAPFDCWLLLRSLGSLGVRVRAQAQGAATLVTRLAEHPAVEEVFHPAHPDHVHYARAQACLPGGSGLFSFTLRDGGETARRVVAGTRLFVRATSLGGVESLIEHRASIEGPGTATPENLIRVSTGLEHVEDLWHDLEQAIARATSGDAG